ncbi:hypothetical protein M405DRAFT_207713 [Rhizopogon salebrosus TDB-379]|nr:hypothetical protein M405DRAFT_207713 [Rhizopogon salebrosus TDB-379]
MGCVDSEPGAGANSRSVFTVFRWLRRVAMTSQLRMMLKCLRPRGVYETTWNQYPRLPSAIYQPLSERRGGSRIYVHSRQERKKCGPGL